MRPLLIGAMVVSLWPAGAIAAIVATGGGSESEASSRSALSASEAEQREANERLESQERAIGRSEGSNESIHELEQELSHASDARERDEARNELVPLMEETRNLNEEFIKVEFAEGVPEQEYGERGAALEEKVTKWETAEGPKAARRDWVVAEAIQGQLEALQALANSPNEPTLHAYNEAVSNVNKAIENAH